ncbi:hypothetical protein PHYPSEUDO_007716 [Phytophthora pseudosyringae]|uniref:Uncharacterized protein n=1 Tax=Phytophthora pseudosyringae TaxID=221518 RepID=A0A8T1WE76_9STRA|nr:hypothetical protein PHYPSEUDO_007716 [Phytophthora pseudosyringae]
MGNLIYIATVEAAFDTGAMLVRRDPALEGSAPSALQSIALQARYENVWWRARLIPERASTLVARGESSPTAPAREATRFSVPYSPMPPRLTGSSLGSDERVIRKWHKQALAISVCRGLPRQYVAATYGDGGRLAERSSRYHGLRVGVRHAERKEKGDIVVQRPIERKQKSAWKDGISDFHMAAMALSCKAIHCCASAACDRGLLSSNAAPGSCASSDDNGDRRPPSRDCRSPG